MIILNNEGKVKENEEDGWNPYFPRLQINKLGEIVLATSKRGSLTTGILVGKTNWSKSDFPIGKVFSDWEVCGELIDYNGEVSVSFKNKVLA